MQVQRRRQGRRTSVLPAATLTSTKLGGPRHSVERGHDSLKRDVARAASSCARHHRQVGQAHQTGGTYSHHNRGHDHTGQPTPAAGASAMAAAARERPARPGRGAAPLGRGARLGPGAPSTPSTHPLYPGCIALRCAERAGTAGGPEHAVRRIGQATWLKVEILGG